MKSSRIERIEERMAAGRALRGSHGRAVHAGFKRAAKTPDLLSIIKATNEGRLRPLVPVKMGRMAVSPFAFFRGAAPVMAADLAPLPTSGLRVQLCGDAHVRNLGAYAAPDGHLVFDLNDFDETIAGPWEWDLKRMATSIHLAGREAGNKQSSCLDAVQSMVRRYREALAAFCHLPALEAARFQIRRQDAPAVLKKVLATAERVTPARVLGKLTTTRPPDGPRFHDEPPVLQHVPEKTAALVIGSLKAYRKTLGVAHQCIFDAYQPVDVAFKIVGTGSVGTRDYVVLMFGHGLTDPLFIQIKEEVDSCYAPYLPEAKPPRHNGQRAAQGQERIQTVSDPFLGWTTIEGRPYLVRQLADHKASLEPTDLKGGILREYAMLCGEVLAKAHGRTTSSAMLAGYCGSSDKLDRAIAAFAHAYSDQVEKDYAVFLKAIRAGKLVAAKVDS